MSALKPRVVIIGGNFAGLVAASRLSGDHDVIVVDPRDAFEWTPNIHELISGVKERDGVVLPRADCVTRYGHRFIHDAVTAIDSERSTVTTAGGLEMSYDACLIAAGSQRTTFATEGADKYSLGFRLVEDAVKIAEKLDRLAARKRRASVVIVGGGVSGIEALGEILRRRSRGDDFNIHVVERESRILEQQPASLADDAVQRLSPFRVTLHTGSTVTQVNARSVLLDNGKKLTADLCIWSAGLAFPDFLNVAGLKTSTD